MLLQLPPPAERETPPAFERVVLDEHVGIGYGVAVADVDGDGRRDVLLVDRREVRWYRAPDWERRLLVGRLTELDHVCIAAREPPGDAKARIAVGAGWNPGDTATDAPAFLLRPDEDPRAPWRPERLGGAPTLHRMKWAADAGGAGRLVALPLHGRGDARAQGAEGVCLLEWSLSGGAAPGAPRVQPTPLHQAHNLDVVEWDGDGDEELVVAAREGLFLLDRRPDAGDAGGFAVIELVGATTGFPGFRGASEVRLGRFADGRRFLAAVEPFHGNELVVYGEPRRPGEPWSRTLLDDSMNEAHALACGDLLGSGEDQIVVGWRRPDARGRTGLRLFAPRGGDAFERRDLDDRIACEDVALGDLDQDGRLDLVAAGRDSRDLVLLLNRAPRAAPRHGARAPLDHPRLEAIDGAVAAALAERRTPGCVVAVGRSDGLVFLRAYGDRSLEPQRKPMTVDALFDLASLTKPVATATGLALLADEGRLDLDDPLAKHLDGLAPAAGAATLRQCLLHTAGFVPDNDLSDYDRGADEAWRRLLGQEPKSAPGTRFVYSDVGYQLLGRVVERISGRGLAEFARERIFAPLAMAETGFLPDDAWKARAAPTERRDGVMLQGVVHDPRAARLGGVAGHAGLFSTAEDLARYARMLLNGGELDGVRILSARGVASLTTPEPATGGALRTPGFDARSRFSTHRGEGMSSRAFGHGGFTGTGLWIDPGLDLFVIFLGSRLHPDGTGVVNPLIGRIGTIAAAAVGRPVPVRTGLEALAASAARGRLAGRTVGLVTNHTGRAIDGTPNWRLLQQRGVRVAAIFTPEHGLDGRRDAEIEDGGDTVDGIPIRSLYGERRKPTAAQLAGLDALLFDVQDAGARCYTYVTTMGLCMEAAAEHGVRFVVLDRPNPIGGERVEGPLPDAGRSSFVNHHPIAFRHGMTVGELARMFRAERLPAVVGAAKAAAFELDVVALEGWRRRDCFDDTRLPWVNPSPNLRTLDAALLYPGLVLFEPTNLSVGRGTDLPFEQLGAPWLDPGALLRALASRPLPGAGVSAVEFTPAGSKFAGERCRGLRVRITDRAALQPMLVALEIAAALRAQHAGEWELDRMDALLCHAATIDALRAGRPVDPIWKEWEAAAAAFRERRRPYLLYQ